MKNRNFLQSLKSGFRGLYIAYLTQRNFRIQVSFAILVLYFGFKFNVGIMNIIILLFTILLVLSFELINASIEFLSDKIEPKYDILIKKFERYTRWFSIIGFHFFSGNRIYNIFKYIKYLTYKSIILSLIIIILPTLIKSNNDIIKKRGDE